MAYSRAHTLFEESGSPLGQVENFIEWGDLWKDDDCNLAKTYCDNAKAISTEIKLNDRLKEVSQRAKKLCGGNKKTIVSNPFHCALPKYLPNLSYWLPLKFRYITVSQLV